MSCGLLGGGLWLVQMAVDTASMGGEQNGLIQIFPLSSACSNYSCISFMLRPCTTKCALTVG